VLRRLADHQVIELRFTGSRTGWPVALPVMHARRGDVSSFSSATRPGSVGGDNFRRPRPVRVLLRGAEHSGIGHVVEPGAAGRAEAADINAARFPAIAHGRADT
jgi:hypothetical protein